MPPIADYAFRQNDLADEGGSPASHAFRNVKIRSFRPKGDQFMSMPKTKPMTKHSADLLLSFPFAAAVAFGAFAAFAQAPAPAQTPAPAAPAQAMPGMGHDHGAMMGDMGHMRSMMHEMMGQMSAQADERIATLKTELKITDAQAPLWKGFADALSAAAKSMDHAHHDMMPPAPAPAPAAAPAAPKAPVVVHGDTSYPDAVAVKKTGEAPAPASSAPAVTPADSSKGLPSRLAHFEEALQEHLASLKAIKTALDPLYAAFSEDQKKIADGLMVGPMGVM
jgi:hypothetical protein